MGTIPLYSTPTRPTRDQGLGPHFWEVTRSWPWTRLVCAFGEHDIISTRREAAPSQSPAAGPTGDFPLCLQSGLRPKSNSKS